MTVLFSELNQILKNEILRRMYVLHKKRKTDSAFLWRERTSLLETTGSLIRQPSFPEKEGEGEIPLDFHLTIKKDAKGSMKISAPAVYWFHANRFIRMQKDGIISSIPVIVLDSGGQKKKENIPYPPIIFLPSSQHIEGGFIQNKFDYEVRIRDGLIDNTLHIVFARIRLGSHNYFRNISVTTQS